MTTLPELPAAITRIANDQLVNADRLALLDAAEIIRATLKTLGEHALTHPEFHDVYLFKLP